MKKRYTLVALLALSTVLGACGTQEETVKEEAKQEVKETAKETEKTQNKEETKEVQKVTIDKKLLVKEEGGLFLDISYPVLSGMINTEKQAALNAEFLQVAKDIEDQTRLAEKELMEAGSDAHAGGSLEVTPYLNTGKIISLDLTGYVYSGGANGTPFHLPFVYDLEEEKKLALTDLFEGETIPEKELIALLNDLFKHTEYGDLLLEEITIITAEQTFYLTEDTVVFTFEKYEYTAGAAGAPEVSVEKTKLPTLKEKYQE